MNNTFRPKRLTSYDDGSIINEIKRVVSQYFGGKTPATRDFNKHSMIHYQTIIDRFGSWASAMEKAGFKYRDSRSIDSKELIEDLNRVKKLNRGMYFTQVFYKENGGKYSFTTLKKLLGCPNWEILLEKVMHLKRAPKVIRIIKPKVKRKRISLFTEGQLFLELKRVWDLLGRRPLYTEFKKMGSIGTRVYERRFGSWTKAIELFCGKFGHNLRGMKGATATPEMLLSELEILASQTSRIFSFKNYKELGGVYSIGTFVNHFGSWKNAVEKIGKRPGPGHTVKYSNEEIFSELQRIWENLGRQPMFKEMKQYSNISGVIYQTRFGSWIKAIHAFCRDRENSDKEENSSKNITAISPDIQLQNKMPENQEIIPEAEEVNDYIVMHTSRIPSLRLRFKVFKRDNFKCVKCGRSPATNPGSELQIDHIKPYTKGGETILDNLQTLCKDCNMGKSDIVT